MPCKQVMKGLRMPLTSEQRAKQTEWVFQQIAEISAEQKPTDVKLAEITGVLKNYPLEYVMWNYPWSSEKSIRMVPLQNPYMDRFNCSHGPDVWACEFLDQLGDEIRKRKFDGTKAVAPIKFSTSSGHGIGKSTLVAWLISFILDCYPQSMGVVTANTGDQLSTKTWAELAKWVRLAITRHLWQYNNSRGNMSLRRNTSDKELAQKWQCNAHTARAENSESFQGLHAANSVPFYIFDEASGIEDKIWEARLGGASDGMPMSFDFGNPTRKSGYFYENCIGKFRDRYIVRQIDSRSVEITNKDLWQQYLEDYGVDSDVFKVKVMGVFPNAGSVQFIPTDSVETAMLRPSIHLKGDPLLIGVDVARFGSNDTVIWPRIGMDARSFPFRRYNGLDNVQVTEKVIEVINEFKRLGRTPSGLFIDGGGLGAGPVDMLRRLGYNPIDVNFGARAGDPKYGRKSDEMWGRMRDAMATLALPNDKDLLTQLTQREYGINEKSGKITLETKADMVERGVQSPDLADALALTFFAEVERNDIMNLMGFQPVVWDYDPLDVKW